MNIVAQYGDVYHTRLSWAEDEIAPTWDPRHAKRDTPLGNLLTDAYRAWTGTDVAIEALGYLEDALPAGWVLGADVFRSMPCGPRLCERQVVAATVAPRDVQTNGCGAVCGTRDDY